MSGQPAVGARIIRAESIADLAAARALIEDYQRWLGLDLCFQGFDAEMRAFPGVYAPPRGRVLLGLHGAEAVGVVCLKDLGEGACEMKRLFVLPGAWGLGLGRALAEAIVAEARSIGYARMRLDTLERLGAAIALYRSLGFSEIAPYNDNPDPTVRYFERAL